MNLTVVYLGVIATGYISDEEFETMERLQVLDFLFRYCDKHLDFIISHVSYRAFGQLDELLIREQLRLRLEKVVLLMLFSKLYLL